MRLKAHLDQFQGREGKGMGAGLRRLLPVGALVTHQQRELRTGGLNPTQVLPMLGVLRVVGLGH